MNVVVLSANQGAGGLTAAVAGIVSSRTQRLSGKPGSGAASQAAACL